MRSTFLALIFLLPALSTLGQTFHPSDTSFHDGDVYTTRKIVWELGSNTLLEDSYETLDSIAAFLLANPTVHLEVSVHKDGRYYRVQHLFSSSLVTSRCESILDYLTDAGIVRTRFSMKTEKRLLISDLEVERMETNEEKEAAHAFNRRVEFKIVLQE